MSMFPGAGAVVYRNEAGEPLGWDYPGEAEYDPDTFLNDDSVRCPCGKKLYDDDDAIAAHGEVCEEARKTFPDAFEDES